MTIMEMIGKPENITYDVGIVCGERFFPIGYTHTKTIDEARKIVKTEREQDNMESAGTKRIHYGIRKIWCGDIWELVEVC